MHENGHVKDGSVPINLPDQVIVRASIWPTCSASCWLHARGDEMHAIPSRCCDASSSVFFHERYWSVSDLIQGLPLGTAAEAAPCDKKTGLGRETVDEG